MSLAPLGEDRVRGAKKSVAKAGVLPPIDAKPNHLPKLAMAGCLGHNDAMQTVPMRRSGGYPLIALFLVITACGIVAALLGPAARAISDGQVGVKELVSQSVASTLLVMLTGGVVGLFHYRRARGFGWGIITGAVIGIFAGPLTLAPRESFGAIISLSFGGAAVIILISVAFCIASRK